MKKIIVTGASGMIGSALIQRCVKEGIEVVAIIRKNSVNKNRIKGNDLIKVIECDLKYLKSLDPNDERLQDADCFYHLAWEGVYGLSRDDINVQWNNVKYSIDAGGLATQIPCKKFVFAGSQAEYGNQNIVLTTETASKPTTLYGIAKNAANQFLRCLLEKKGVTYCEGRVLSVYGVNDNKNTMISYLIGQLLKNEICYLSSCEQIWDYIYIDDVADAFFAIGESGKDKTSYPIGGGDSRKLKDYVEEVKSLCKSSCPIEYGKKIQTDNALTFLKADISALKRDTGFKIRTSFRDGILKTLEWMKNDSI